MKVPSNLIKDIRSFYAKQLEPLYGKDESNALIIMLLQHYFDIDRIKIAMEPDLRLNESELLTFHFAVKELLKHRPIQYVIGEAWFCDMKFYVDESVLIPRPETAEMMSLIMKEFSCEEELNILDIGTGSGCIAVTLAKAFPKSHVTAIDISEESLNTARRNAYENQVNIEFIKNDILNIGDELSSRKFDLIVSNPPYIRESEKKEMKHNILDYEPNRALFVTDEDPLVFYREILLFAKNHLNKSGQIWFEINEFLGKQMRDLCLTQNFDNVMIIKDFRDKERFCSVHISS